MLECISIFFCFGARGHSKNLFEQCCDSGVCFRPHMSAIRQENFSENICFFPSLVRFDVFFQTCGEKKPAEISQRCLFLVQMLK